MAPVVSWAQPAAIAPEQERFEVEVSNDGFATIAVASGTVEGDDGRGTAWAVPTEWFMSGRSYAIRVRAGYADGLWSDWSTPVDFVYGDLRPGPVDIVDF